MIYILEDDESIRKLVVYGLESQGFTVEGFALPSAFHRAMERALPELVLLDLMLPEEDGLHILRDLRASAATRTLPVILLTARDTEYDRVIGLDGGADDFITKPFSMLELAARIRAVLRRTGSAAPREYRAGPLRVCPAQRIVQVDDADITLTNKEFELLCLLLENQGIVLARATLMDRVWGMELERENRTLDVHVRTLRAKLGPAGGLIETVRGVGYRIGGHEDMTAKIFRNSFFVGLLVLLAAGILFLSVMYANDETFAFDELRAETAVLAPAVERLGLSYLRSEPAGARHMDRAGRQRPLRQFCPKGRHGKPPRPRGDRRRAGSRRGPRHARLARPAARGRTTRPAAGGRLGAAHGLHADVAGAADFESAAAGALDRAADPGFMRSRLVPAGSADHQPHQPDRPRRAGRERRLSGAAAAGRPHPRAEPHHPLPAHGAVAAAAGIFRDHRTDARGLFAAGRTTGTFSPATAARRRSSPCRRTRRTCAARVSRRRRRARWRRPCPVRTPRRCCTFRTASGS